jgi:hypothetical protein
MMTIKKAKELYGDKTVAVYQFALSIGADMSIFKEEIDILPPPKIDDAFVRSFLSKWPTPKVTGLSYAVGGQKAEVKARFVNLLKKWGKITDTEFSEELALSATDMYLAQQKKEGWKYTQKAYNFVLRGEVSMLASYMEQIANGEDTTQKRGFYI